MLFLIFRFIFSGLQSHRALVLENLALRHQLDVLKRNTKTPRLRNRDRVLWVILSRLWPDWRGSLAIVQPKTVVAWHRRGWRLYWRWRSRGRGRPKLSREVRELIRRISRENPLWGAPRIHGELLKLELLHRPHPDLQDALRLRHPLTRSASRPPRQRHRLTHSGLDEPADCPGVSVRHRPAVLDS